ncbi:hypothetical protein [Micromonospora sp. DT227]|uniref:hypothetical protein n=1 Tax=Micromonospora sp. DT227 TaxID=3393433 RepID=UPI003CF56917
MRVSLIVCALLTPELDAALLEYPAALAYVFSGRAAVEGRRDLSGAERALFGMSGRRRPANSIHGC